MLNIRRIHLLLAAGALAAGFRLVYVLWVSPYFAYYGLTYEDISFERQLLVWVLSIAPALWLPVRLTRPTEAIYLVLYATVYVPSIFIALQGGQVAPPDDILLALALFLGVAVTGASYCFRVPRIVGANLPLPLLNAAIITLAVAGNAWIIATCYSIMRIPDLKEIYELRFANSDLVQNSLVRYALMIMPGAVDPLLIAFGLARRSWIWLLSGIAGYVVVFMATGLKGDVLFPLMAIGLWPLMRRRDRLPQRLILGTGALLGVFALLEWAIGIDQPESSLFALASILATRGFSIHGLLMSRYFIYFSSHPLTHFTHVNVIARIAGIPVTQLVNVEIGTEFWGSPDLSANAGFWAEDGLASLGLPGILVASALVAALFWLMDAICVRHDLRVCTIALLFQALNLANLSLFTSILSGGLGLSLLLLWAMPPHQALQSVQANIPVSVRRRKYLARGEPPQLMPARPG